MKDQSKEILTAEFEYIASTANQANEDRARVSSFYLVSVGSLVAALFGAQFVNEQINARALNMLLAGLFLTLTLLGALTIIQLARLRGAWFEAMLAMNQIKQYVVGKDKDLAKAFRWSAKTAPPVYKLNSISYQQTLEVALLSGLTFGAAVYCFQNGIGAADSSSAWIYASAGAAAAFLVQLWVYDIFIKKERKKLNLPK